MMKWALAAAARGFGGGGGTCRHAKRFREASHVVRPQCRCDHGRLCRTTRSSCQMAAPFRARRRSASCSPPCSRRVAPAALPAGGAATAPSGPPAGGRHEGHQVWEEGNVGFMTWEAGPMHTTEEFIIRNGKIAVQAIFMASGRARAVRRQRVRRNNPEPDLSLARIFASSGSVRRAHRSSTGRAHRTLHRRRVG